MIRFSSWGVDHAALGVEDAGLLRQGGRRELSGQGVEHVDTGAGHGSSRTYRGHDQAGSEHAHDHRGRHKGAEQRDDARDVGRPAGLHGPKANPTPPLDQAWSAC